MKASATFWWVLPNGVTSTSLILSNLYAGDYVLNIVENMVPGDTNSSEICSLIDTISVEQTIQLTASYNLNATSVLWSTNTGFTDTLSQSSNLIVASIGMFYVKVSNGICEQIDSVEVQTESLNISLFANDTCKGGAVFVGVNNENPIIPIISYNWASFLSDSSSIIDLPDSSRWYQVEVENGEGCILTDSIFVNIYQNPIIDSVWLNKEISNYKNKNILLVEPVPYLSLIHI